jgi:hypothetical protein
MESRHAASRANHASGEGRAEPLSPVDEGAGRTAALSYPVAPWPARCDHAESAPRAPSREGSFAGRPPHAGPGLYDRSEDDFLFLNDAVVER